MATKSAPKEGASSLKITLTSGKVGKLGVHRKVITALGLRKFGSSVVHSDTPTIRGMVRKIIHLISVEPTSEQPKVANHKHLAAKAEKTAKTDKA